MSTEVADTVNVVLAAYDHLAKQSGGPRTRKALREVIVDYAFGPGAPARGFEPPSLFNNQACMSKFLHFRRKLGRASCSG